MAELCELLGGRVDLLAGVAGIFEGASEGRDDEPLARCATGLSARPGPTWRRFRGGPRSAASVRPSRSCRHSPVARTARGESGTPCP